MREAEKRDSKFRLDIIPCACCGDPVHIDDSTEVPGRLGRFNKRQPCAVRLERTRDTESIDRDQRQSKQT